jgi:plastocyanin
MGPRHVRPLTSNERLKIFHAGRRDIVVALLALALMALSLGAASCGGNASSSSETTATTGGTGANGTQVVMKDMAFDPATVTIKAGETVTWTNEDSASHTVVGDGGEFESDSLSTGDTFSFTFDTAGTYAYHCSIHPSMKASVIVE